MNTQTLRAERNAPVIAMFRNSRRAFIRLAKSAKARRDTEHMQRFVELADYYHSAVLTLKGVRR